MVKRAIKNLFLVVLSIVFTFILIENILSISGKLYFWHKVNNVNIAAVNKKPIKILCLGDSFTFGMGADKRNSYPEQLSQMLNSNTLNDKSYIIFNRGAPGNTSTKLLESLEENLKIYKPDILIILIGMNDRDTLEKTNYFLFRKVSLKSRILHYLINTKVHKLFQKAKESWEVHSWRKRLLAIYGSNRVFESLKLNSEITSNAATKMVQKARDHNALGLEYFYNEQNIQLNSAITEFKKAIEIMPDDPDGYRNLASVFLRIDKFDLALEQLKKAMRINPYDQDIWRGIWFAYYMRGEVSLAKEMLQRYLYLNPGDISKYLLFLKYGFPDRNDALFDNLLYFNLQKTIDIARRKRITVILQQYPCLEVKSDLVVDFIAGKNKVPLVRNSFIFEKLALQSGYRHFDYFVEDGHCNNKGYSIMAENVYSKLISIFPQIAVKK